MKFIFTLLSVFLTLVLFFPHLANAQAQTAKFLLNANKSDLSAGDTLVLTVKLNTGDGNQVNSYQAHLTYPEDQLTFESVNTDGSPFDMALEAKGGNGTVNIVRGSTTSQTGELLVGSITFKTKSTANAGSIKVANDSAIIKSPDNVNILEGSTVQNNQPATLVKQPETENPKFDLTGIWNKVVSFFNSLFN